MTKAGRKFNTPKSQGALKLQQHKQNQLTKTQVSNQKKNLRRKQKAIAIASQPAEIVTPVDVSHKNQLERARAFNYRRNVKVSAARDLCSFFWSSLRAQGSHALHEVKLAS